MKTIAFIPARCGSKSIPLKNIKLFCGKPLIYWSLKAVSDVETVDEVYVATDCEEIKSVVEGFGLPKVKIYLREEENARDQSSTESVVLEFFKNHGGDDGDTFLLIQATNPLTQSSDFRNALMLYRQQGADSLLSCARLKIFLWNSNGTPINYDFNNRPRRQEVNGELMENGAFYISSVGKIREAKNRLSGKIAIYEMPDYTAIDIDDQDDWVVGEMLMNKYILKQE
ncbi:MAG: acylneuraminate cytidylyltransferase family protein [Proteobacteria bacterium]|nr:acylneuraminate cytidylyltransferase family protein [Pseudomonadota bacterium]MBU1737709.1 acylneuraminate cytidylyltransferase family protein [Pseudomonadota bacterium]